MKHTADQLLEETGAQQQHQQQRKRQHEQRPVRGELRLISSLAAKEFVSRVCFLKCLWKKQSFDILDNTSNLIRGMYGWNQAVGFCDPN
ncbi:hypothetical protein ABW19_dt0205442 [Dactylella cylindrospora]|nr:hypothetical protein ABW19_dt0205442 [Dactylella cylindrospora]